MEFGLQTALYGDNLGCDKNVLAFEPITLPSIAVQVTLLESQDMSRELFGWS